MIPAPGRRPSEGVVFGRNCACTLASVGRSSFQAQAGSGVLGPRVGLEPGCLLSFLATGSPTSSSFPEQAGAVPKAQISRHRPESIKPGTAGPSSGTNGLCDLGQVYSLHRVSTLPGTRGLYGGVLTCSFS
ncbi:unnamed protein product [Rangifer tarandus platyrhynchus]|uniref:Uncharacterized protein n=1 Tax=Rangifer tarandus platyrhynchus TaxID=3082113 RepID=A0ABN8ZJL0_RANTA|nr:unnamed protein product [Rangifer tarandus platyrhynchus]